MSKRLFLFFTIIGCFTRKWVWPQRTNNSILERTETADKKNGTENKNGRRGGSIGKGNLKRRNHLNEMIYSSSNITQIKSITHKRVRNTTTSLLPSLFQKQTSARAEQSLQTAIEAITVFPDSPKLKNPITSAEEKQKRSILSTLLSEGHNSPDLKLHYDPLLTSETSKDHEEKMNKEYFVYDDNYLKELFDIIVLTGTKETDLHYLNDWKPLIEGMHLIIIQQGHPKRSIDIPTWVEYELYNKKEIDRTFTKLQTVLNRGGGGAGNYSFQFNHKLIGVSPLFDLTNDAWTAANYGFLVSDRDYIFFLNRNMKPIFSLPSDANRALNQNPVDLLRIHALNLMKPSLSSYYNYGQDPFHRAYDYWKGYPYSLRDGLETVMSIGTNFHEQQQDRLTQIVKTASLRGMEKLSASKSVETSGEKRKLRATESEDEKVVHRIEDRAITQTIPKAVHFTLNFDNVAFNRKAIGPFFSLISGAEGLQQYFQFGEDYYHILLGWLMKSAFDHIGYGVKHFDSSNYLQSMRKEEENLSKSIQQDLAWLQMNEIWYTAILNYRPNNTSEAKDGYQYLLGLINFLKEIPASSSVAAGTFQASTEFFTNIESIFIDYHQLWQLRHDYQTSFLPIASKSSFAPDPTSSHKCAVFTITYNDIEMLSIWIRYFTRHFPSQDVYVLNHHSSAIQDPIRQQKYQEKLQFLQRQYKIRIIDLYGEKTGFPMMFFIRTADIFQRRLYRYGYQCTILTDTDEMIIADPDIYPNGLHEYLEQFVKDEKRTAVRAHGHIIGQLSTMIPSTKKPTRNEGKQINVDAPFNWSENLFSQRNYWAVQPKYSKPILSRIAVRHYPGFHNLYYPKPVKLDTKLLLLHLRDIDAVFCQEREYIKAMIVQNTSFQSELQKGLSTHLVHYQEKLARGEVCQYSYCKYFIENQTVYDNTMEFVMHPIPARFKTINV